VWSEGDTHSRTALYHTLRILPDSSSKTAFERAVKWLSHCAENDKYCKVPDPTYMPRRLLNVGAWNGAGDGSREPFLSEPKRPVEYAALSYCWGMDVEDVLKTTKDNLQSLYETVPLSSLPATISDAIKLCRGLNISYLWVDSLCIIQDDKEEWLRDSAQMREIYSNSHLAIFAREPNSCKLGFLGKQQYGASDWQNQIFTDVPIGADGPGNEVYIRPLKPELFQDHDRSSLDRRGWCLQETILPNRNLLFDGTEMVWECQHRKLCECGHFVWTRKTEHYGNTGVQFKLDYAESFKRERSYEAWRAVVEEYSDRALTQKMDKLSALSGLAKMMVEDEQNSSEASPVYMAGLWKKDFVFELTWRVVSFGEEILGEPQPPSTPYRAPSWS
jgi:hypothetical protein